MRAFSLTDKVKGQGVLVIDLALSALSNYFSVIARLHRRGFHQITAYHAGNPINVVNPDVLTSPARR